MKDVFSRNVVADFYNENFVSVSYDIERDKSPEFLDMPKISSIPLLLFVNPSTLKIVHGFLGGIDESGMLELGGKLWMVNGIWRECGNVIRRESEGRLCLFLI